MGVSGTGKSTIGKVVAAELGCDFAEGDDMHPQTTLDKMRGGTPLTDERGLVVDVDVPFDDLVEGLVARLSR